MAQHPIPAGRCSIAGRTVVEGKAVHVADVLADPEFQFKEAAKVGGSRTMLGVPLLREGKPIGVIALHRTSVRPFSEKQIELAQTFADQAVIAIENVRLFDEVQARTRDLSESLQQQTATSEVLSVISSSPGELEPVFQAMLENATRICEAKFGTLYLYDGDAFRAEAFHNAPPAFVEARKRQPVRPPPDSALGRLAITKQVAHIADLKATQSYIERNPYTVVTVDLAGYRTIVSVPMFKDNELIGAINIYRQEVRPFTSKHIELVTNFAAQAVIAIENARLLNELRQRTDDLSEALEQQTATSEVLRVISSSPAALEPVFETMLANAVRLCEAKFGNLFLREGNAFRAVAVHSPSTTFVEWYRREPLIELSDISHTPLARVADSKEVLHIFDVREDQAYLERNPRFVTIVESANARTILGVPMLKADELVGAIVIYRQEVRPFTEKQIELVTNFAAQAVIAIENTRLLKELRQRTDDLSESLQQQTATADVLKVISRSTFDLQAVLNALVESAARLCGADMAAIVRLHGSSFRHAASYGYTTELHEHMLNFRFEPGRGTAAGRVALEGRVVQIADIRADPEFVLGGPLGAAGARTILGIPLVREGSPIGVI